MAGTVNTVTSLLKSCTVSAAPICVGVRVSVTGRTWPTATVTLPAAVAVPAAVGIIWVRCPSSVGGDGVRSGSVASIHHESTP